MKTCPVCGAVAFDDAAVCYGCLHDFAREHRILPEPLTADTYGEVLEAEAPAFSAAGEAGVGGGEGDAVASCVAAGPQPPAFLITLEPQRRESGAFAWSCSVALASP